MHLCGTGLLPLGAKARPYLALMLIEAGAA
jgi:hypothetical protein